jgi:iron complex transport system permease protein
MPDDAVHGVGPVLAASYAMTQLSPQPVAADAPLLTARKLLLLAGIGAAIVVAVGIPCSFLGQADTTSLVWKFRVYRLLTAAAVGAALASAGMALQGLLRNPLAEPYILGISSGAGVGVLAGLAVPSLAFGPAWLRHCLGSVPFWASTPTLAFAGALGACVVVYGIAQRRGRLDSYSLILSGVIVNIFNGAIMLTMYLFLDPYRISDFARWSMGYIPEAPEELLLLVCCLCVLAGWGLLFLLAAALNALALGDEVAASSGVAVHRLRLLTFVLTGVITAAAVSLAGPIGFVGLIVPHICRMIAGPDHRKLMIISGFAGAVFLMLADTLCRTVGPLLGVNKVPVGIVTALCGGPFFIYLLRRRLRETPV